MSDSDILTAIYNNCDPTIAADERFYVDCTDVRGGVVFARKLCAELSRTNTYIKALFTGHIGCGKSSELNHLASRMGQKQPWQGQKRFFPILVDMSEYLNEYDVDVTDILLAVVTEVAEAFREELTIDLKDGYFKTRWEELTEYLGSPITVDEGQGTVGWIKATIKRLRTEPSQRRKVREKLRPQTGQLLSEINLAFVEAREKLQTHTPADGGQRYSDFVLLLDRLDRVQKVGDKEDGYESQRFLFVDNGQQLNSLQAHVVYTVPLPLVRNIGSQLQTLYSKELFVLPMIKTEHRGRDHQPYEKGRDRLAQILQRRMPPGVALANVIEDSALEFLQQYSGGHVRNFLMFVREATNLTDDRLPITYKAVRDAIKPTVNILGGSLKADDWKRLAKLELSQDQAWDNNDEEKRRLLQNLVVLEYVNGEEGDEEEFGEESFEEDAPWYAVNPFIRRLKSFRLAVEALEKNGEG